MHPGSFFQNYYTILGSKVSSEGYIHHFNRPERCLFAYSCGKGFQTLPRVHVPGSEVSVPNHAFRTVSCPQNIHQSSSSCSKDVKRSKYTNFGQPVDLQSLQHRLLSECCKEYKDAPCARFSYQLGKIQTDSFKRIRMVVHSLRHFRDSLSSSSSHQEIKEAFPKQRGFYQTTLVIPRTGKFCLNSVSSAQDFFQDLGISPSSDGEAKKISEITH